MSCNCGCGGCQTKIQGPLLTESKVKSLLSEGLQYHIDKQIPLFETVYRIGSEKHLSLIKEARKMYSRNVIDLCEEDEALIKTHLGEFGIYEGESVPLDLPMLEEELQERYYSDEKAPTADDELDGYVYNPTGPNGENEKWSVYKNIKTGEYNSLHRTIREPERPTKYAPDETEPKEYERLHGYVWNPNSEGEDEKWAVYWDPKTNTFNTRHRSNNYLDEAEFKGKDVPLNKPKRGGSKAYYVYVRDPKTKKVKKVSFGSGGLRAKIKNKEARNAFAARHNCKDKKDRTKAGYWSCNLPRYAKALGLGANMNTFW